MQSLGYGLVSLGALAMTFTKRGWLEMTGAGIFVAGMVVFGIGHFS